MEQAEQTLRQWRERISGPAKMAFFTALVLGTLVHLPAMLAEIPNHDGLASLYFDQNMITSGRWFLEAACGISSFYSVPWVIGLLGMTYLGVTAALIVSICGVRSRSCAALTGGLLVSFPSVASTFAYVFTLDGYLLGLLLAVLAVYLAKRSRGGWLPGAVLLALSLGIYQAYLPFAMLLSIFCIAQFAMFEGEREDWERVSDQFRYVYLGLGGAALYYVVLQILLKIQGKELDTYQGIDGLGGGALAGGISGLPELYRDFFRFSRSRSFLQNGFGVTALSVLALLAATWLVRTALRRGWHKKMASYAILIFAAVCIPVSANAVLLVTPGVNYHLMMRFQWVLFPVFAIALIERLAAEEGREPGPGGAEKDGSTRRSGRLAEFSGWVVLACGVVLIFCYALADNIGYTNLRRKYEKTYAYCVRLLDRIEQAEGYYPGVPVALVGVIGEDSYPPTDLTGDVTGGMIGLDGDFLLYTAPNYDAFFRSYLGATLNLLGAEEVTELYYSDEYIAMESFPGESSVKMIDGVICVKTENARRD